ncbi:hypothetical protein DICVIV_04672 [Dictyocaulus viviparus]|uniref:Rhodanese domain-containing protein n=1 Tax=Dictyocaulus viviparus TaxID=29172 RepID=A0A0D8XZE7_DICVI|nr:hypothetical protein DICVIV_04672 [Dictyocaulus viviparus]
MLLPGDNFQSIDIHKFVRFLIYRANGRATPLEDFIIVDVNDHAQYVKEHIITAEHFNRFTLSRNHFETPLLATARLQKRTLVIYGQSANMVTSTLHQRDYKAVYLSGSIPFFTTFYPKGLTTKTGDTIDIAALQESLQKKIDSDRGGRLWKSTSASRLHNVNAKNNISVSAKKHKIPWK